MGMRVENCVDASNVFADRLRVEVRSGVDQDDLAAILDHHRRSRTAIMRIRRPAHGTVAAERGHAH